MAFVTTDWSIDRATGNIRYIGDDHGGTAPSYATVLELHRALQDFADNATSSGDDELDITDENPSERQTDNIIRLLGIYNINDIAAEHLYNGSIIQGSGGTEVIYDGIVNFGNADASIQIIQNGAVIADDWWNYNVGGTHTGAADASVLTDSTASWTTDQWIGYTIKNTTDGSYGQITANTSTTITATLYGGTENDWDNGDSYLIAQGLNSDSAQGISHRFLIKVRNAGADIDGRRILGTTRRFGNTYGEFFINGSSRGNNVLALTDASDLNNSTAIATVAAITDIYIDRTASTATVSGINNSGQTTLSVSDGTQFTAGDFIMIAGDDHEYQIDSIATNDLTLNRNLQVTTAGGETIYDLNIGFSQIDVDNNASTENYYAQWDKGAQTINTFFERMKFLSADNSVHYIYGLPGELFRGITHQITVDTPTGTFAPVEDVSWSGGTGQMLAINSPTAGTTMWIQLLTGVAPTDGQVITGGISGATVTVNVTVADRSSLVDTPFVGASTGSALIGSYGLALQTNDLTNNDTLFDLSNSPVTPPNNVQNTVSGVVSGEDYVLVAPWDGSSTDNEGNPAINTNQFLLSTALTADNITSVVIKAGDEGPAIPVDTPSSGTIRVVDNNGFARRLEYSSWTGSTFTISSVDGQEDFGTVNASADNHVYITYIDKLADATTASYTAVYTSNRNLVVVVRDGGTVNNTPIKQFISEWSFSSSPQTLSAIRTSDL